MNRRTRRHLAAGLAAPPARKSGPAPASPLADPQRALGVAGLEPRMPWAAAGAQPFSELLIGCFQANRDADACRQRAGGPEGGRLSRKLFGWQGCILLGPEDHRLLLGAHNTRRRACEALSGSIDPRDWPAPGMAAPATLEGVNRAGDGWGLPQVLPAGYWPGWPDGWALFMAPQEDGISPAVEGVCLRLDGGTPEEWLRWARRHPLALLRTR